MSAREWVLLGFIAFLVFMNARAFFMAHKIREGILRRSMEPGWKPQPGQGEGGA